MALNYVTSDSFNTIPLYQIRLLKSAFYVRSFFDVNSLFKKKRQENPRRIHLYHVTPWALSCFSVLASPSTYKREAAVDQRTPKSFENNQSIDIIAHGCGILSAQAQQSVSWTLNSNQSVNQSIKRSVSFCLPLTSLHLGSRLTWCYSNQP